MKLYQIKYATSASQIGSTFPQSQDSIEKINVADPVHLWNIQIGNPINIIGSPEPILHKRAKQTDLISCSTISIRLVISNTLKQILTSFATPEDYQCVPTKLWKGSQYFDYWIWNPLIFRYETIDFTQSEVWTGPFRSCNQKIPVNNEKEFQQIIDATKYPQDILIKKLIFKESIDHHFIQLMWTGEAVGYFISEELKEEIMAQGCTGIEFMEKDL
jgi:hypothetical protein